MCPSLLYSFLFETVTLYLGYLTGRVELYLFTGASFANFDSARVDHEVVVDASTCHPKGCQKIKGWVAAEVAMEGKI